MADFHFFTDLHLLRTQKNYSSFNVNFGLPFGLFMDAGPNDNALYRFCPASMHNGKADVQGLGPKAYAVCDGQVFFIEIQNTSHDGETVNRLVDAIFLPDVQAEVNPRVKYLIYRSILRSSIVCMNTVTSGGINYEMHDILPTDLANGVDIVKKANDAHIAVPLNVLPARGSILGLSPGGIGNYEATKPAGTVLSPNSFLDDIFYFEYAKNVPPESAKYNSFSVKAGDVIGRFPHEDEFEGVVSGSSKKLIMHQFGLQILLDRRGFEPKIKDIIPASLTFSTASRMDALRRVVSIDFNDDADTEFEAEVLGEAALNFMDPAAFYGNFAHASSDRLFLTDIGSDTDNTVATRSVPSPFYGLGATYEENAQLEIYHRVMLGTGNSFASDLFINKNTIYISLLDERGNSHNFFHQFGVDEYTSQGLRDLRYEWNTNPGVKVVDSSKNYSSATPNKIYPILLFNALPGDDQVDQDNPVILKLEFKKTEDFGACYSAYVNNGVFVRDRANVTTLIEANGSKFTAIGGDDSGDYTDVLQLQILHFLQDGGGSNISNKPIAQHITITVIKNQYEIQNPPPMIPFDAGYTHGAIPKLRDLEYLDNLWCPFEYRMKMPLSIDLAVPGNSTNLNVRVCEQSAYWNNTQADGQDYMADTGLAIEYDNAGTPLNYILFANAYESRFERFDINEAGMPISRVSLVPNNANALTQSTRAVSFLSSMAGSTSRPFQLAVDINNSFTDPTTGNSPTLQSLIVNPRATGGAAVPPVGNLRRFTSGFTSVHFSAADWNALTAIYQGTFLDGSMELQVKGSRVYMAFQNDGVELDTNGNEFVRFRVLLRGLVKIAGTNEVEMRDVDHLGANGPIYHYVTYGSHDASQNAKLRALAFDGRNGLGSGHIIHLDPGNPTVIGESFEGNVPQVGIEAHMNFARGIGMTWLDLKNLQDAVIENINQVWDSKYNGGMWQINDPDPGIGPTNYKAHLPGFTGFTLDEIKKYPDDGTGPGTSNLTRVRIRPKKLPLDTNAVSDGISCSAACPIQYSYLPPGQSLITADRDLANQRSFVTGRRTGMFFCNYPNAVQNSPLRTGADILLATGINTFAHEFGHLMGLQDRYCFFGREYTGPFGHTVANEPNNVTAAIYISNAIDPEYHNDYRWRYNLMSFAAGVPNDQASLSQSRFFESGTTILEQSFFNEYKNYVKNNFLSDTSPKRNFVFITTKQWLHIKNYTDENGFFGGTAMFFKHLEPPVTPDATNEFDRSFVGFQQANSNIPGDCIAIVTDDKLQVGSGVSYPSMDVRASQPREGGVTVNFWGWVQGNNLIQINRSPQRVQDAVTGGASFTIGQMTSVGEIQLDQIANPAFQINLSTPFPVALGVLYYDFYDADTPTVNLIGGPLAPCLAGNSSIAGVPNNRGIDLWEAHQTATGEFTGFLPFAPAPAIPVGIVRYDTHFNRLNIIAVIASGSG